MNMKSPGLRSATLSLLGLGLLVAFIYYVYVNIDEYMKLLKISPLSILLLLTLPLAFPVINGIINTILFQRLGTKISYKNGVLLAAATSLANQLPIPGGILSKGFYLKRLYNLSYTKFISATLALFFCFVAVNGIIGISIMLYWKIFNNLTIFPALLIGFLVMATFLLVFWFPLGRIRLPAKILWWFTQAIDGWVLIRKAPILLLKLIGLQTSLMLLLAFRYWIAFHMLSQDVSVGEAILFSSASVLTQLVSFAPGGVGVTEAIVGATASALGFDFSVSIVAVGLDRLLSTSVILLVGGISAVILSSQISKENVDSKDRE